MQHRSCSFINGPSSPASWVRWDVRADGSWCSYRRHSKHNCAWSEEGIDGRQLELPRSSFIRLVRHIFSESRHSRSGHHACWLALLSALLAQVVQLLILLIQRGEELATSWMTVKGRSTRILLKQNGTRQLTSPETAASSHDQQTPQPPSPFAHAPPPLFIPGISSIDESGPRRASATGRGRGPVLEALDTSLRSTFRSLGLARSCVDNQRKSSSQQLQLSGSAARSVRQCHLRRGMVRARRRLCRSWCRISPPRCCCGRLRIMVTLSPPS